MKNAFDVNLPKSNPKFKSPVSTLASSSSTTAGTGNEAMPETEARRSPKAPRRRWTDREEARETAPVVPLKPPESARHGATSAETRTAWLAMLEELEAHLNSALETRDTARSETERARQVLSRTADAAADALQRLAHTEHELEARRSVLTSLLAEIDALEDARSEALDLAQRLSHLDDPSPRHAPRASASHLEGHDALSEVRNALLSAVQAIPARSKAR